MNFSKFLMGGAACAALLFLSGCNGALKEDNGGKEEPEKVKVEFSQNEISIPVKGAATLELTVTPIERAGEVEVVVADDKVVTLSGKEATETGIRLTLTSNSSLGSTTVYAVHEDLEGMPECKVVITPIALESISLDKTAAELKVYETITLSPTLTPADVTSPTLIWSSDDPEVASVDNGVVTANKPGTATITVSCNGKQATCVVKVSSIPAESIKLYFDKAEISEKEISVEESFRIDAEILPEEATYKTVSEWSVSDPEVLSCDAIYISDNTLSAYVTGKTAGTAQVIAKVEIGEGKDALVAICNVTVKAPVPPVDPPKIGDYFYSDGTWSDGGLLSINSDGTNPVWKTGADKPAPVDGKTVIGIVFQTNPDRISEAEKALGYTHGLVMSLKRAYKPIELLDRSNPYEVPDSLTKFCAFDDLNKSYIDRSSAGTRYYSDINGYSAVQGILKDYPGDALTSFPAVDWTMRGFVAAPASTSGWYVPSSGQVWDLLANLAGNEIAVQLKELRTYDKDVSYLDFANLSYDPIAELNSHWSLVPAEMKENMNGDRNRSGYSYFLFLTSSQYNSEFARCFWVASRVEGAGSDAATVKGQFAPYLTWLNDPMTCYPVLSF